MRHRYFVLLACLSLACHRSTPAPPPAPIPVPTPTPEPPLKPDDTVSLLLDAHNQLRATKGLKPLVGNAKLQAAAQAHSDYMAKVGRMDHQGIGDGSPWDRIAKTGYSMGAGAENVAMGQRDVASVMTAWKGSSGHYRNIVGAYREFGGALTVGKDGQKYWCTVFASPAFGFAASGEPTITIQVDQDADGNFISAARFDPEGGKP